MSDLNAFLEAPAARVRHPSRYSLASYSLAGTLTGTGRRRAAWLTCSGLFVAVVAGAATPRYETPPVLKASAVLPADVRAGANHRVEDRVTNDGYMNHYAISSRFGDLKASSTADLRKKVQELNAVALMEKVRGSEEYERSLKSSGTAAAAGMKNLVTNPAGAITGAATGVGKIFRQTGEAIAGTPHSQGEDPALQEISGFSKTKRDYAYHFGVDVYSDNPILQERLNELAKVGYLGGLTVGAAMALIPGGVGLAVSASNTTRLLNDVMRASSPSDLRRMNREKLQAMGVSQDVADLFVTNTAYSPRRQTTLVAALDRMSGTADRHVFVRFSAAADDPEVAYFRQRQAEMYAGYHSHVTPIERFVPLGQVVAGRTKAGALVVAAPVDYLVWTHSVAALAEGASDDAQALKGSKIKELWVAGKLSPLARKSLHGLGWTVREDGESRLLADAPL
jgi:hypothetical protein